MKLISMTDFVLQDNGNILNMQYAKFLKQPLELGMFIPCGDNGNVLEHPDSNLCITIKDFKQYQKAKERCLFEGFEIRDHFGDKCLYSEELNSFFGYFDKEDFCFFDKIIEDLLKYNLQLTETAIKQIG